MTWFISIFIEYYYFFYFLVFNHNKTTITISLLPISRNPNNVFNS